MRTIINPVGNFVGSNAVGFSRRTEAKLLKTFKHLFRVSLQDDNILLLVAYAKLSKYIESINIIFNEYTAGNFGVVANILTLSIYQEIILELDKLALDSCLFPDYEEIRKNYLYVISGLYQSILQYSSLIDLQHKLEQCKERAAILNDPNKLRDFINKMKQNIFPDSNIQVIKATIKPEYLEYIKKYGYPEGNVFDPIKLTGIIKQLNQLSLCEQPIINNSCDVCN
jgi:hypothetical protein